MFDNLLKHLFQKPVRVTFLECSGGCDCVIQADDEGARRPAEPGPFSAGQCSSSAGPRAGHSAPSHSLLAHHTRLRLAGHRRRHDCHPELPQRDDQVHGQELSSCRWSRSVRDRRQAEEQGRPHSQVDVEANRRHDFVVLIKSGAYLGGLAPELLPLEVKKLVLIFSVIFM